MTAKPKKRDKKVYPKIKLESATDEEFYAAYNITPAEIRRARALVNKIMDENRRKAAKHQASAAKSRTAAR